MIYKLEHYLRICGNCTVMYDCYKLPGDFTYGEFLLRSEKTDELAYLNAIDNKVYTEVFNIISELNKNLNEHEKANLLQDIFGFACDLAKDNSSYHINLKPKCPNCGARNPKLSGLLPKRQYIEKELPLVTHIKWNDLNSYHRKALIEKAILHHHKT